MKPEPVMSASVPPVPTPLPMPSIKEIHEAVEAWRDICYSNQAYTVKVAIVLHDELVALAASNRALCEALAVYADRRHWSDETLATEGGEEECTVYTSNRCIFFDNKDGFITASEALAKLPTLHAPAGKDQK